MPDDATEQRLIDLEVGNARLQETLDELSDVVRRQGEAIDRLMTAVMQLERDRLARAEAMPGIVSATWIGPEDNRG